MSERLPLEGRGIAITRAEPPGGPLERRLADLGARVLRWCALEIAPPEDPRPLERAAGELERYDWIVFASAHGVVALEKAMGGRSPKDLGERCPRVAAVGPATAAAAVRAGWRVERMPTLWFGAAWLVEAFIEAGDPRGRRVLIPASASTSSELGQGLESLGMYVKVVEAYRPVPLALDAAACRAALEAGEVDAITFTSPSAINGLARALGSTDFTAALTGRIVVSIGPTTTRALTAHGRQPDTEARPSTLDGLVAAVVRALSA